MADAVQTLPNTKNELIVSLVQKELKEKTNLFPFIEDLSRFAVKGAKSVSVPRMSSFTAVSRTLGAAQDAVALTDTKDTITLDHFPYVAWIEDHADNYQSTIDFRIEASLRAASAHARYIDNQIIAIAKSVAGLSVNAAVPADITKDDILDMREYIISENGNLDASVLVIAPDQEKAMLKIDSFTRADIYGTSNIPTGMIGRVYGVPVIINNLVEASQAYLWEKSGIGFAFGQNTMMSEQNANEYGSMSKRVAVDQALGVDGLQIAVGGAAAGKSPLVTKLFDGL